MLNKIQRSIGEYQVCLGSHDLGFSFMLKAQDISSLVILSFGIQKHI